MLLSGDPCQPFAATPYHDEYKHSGNHMQRTICRWPYLPPSAPLPSWPKAASRTMRPRQRRRGPPGRRRRPTKTGICSATPRALASRAWREIWAAGPERHSLVLESGFDSSNGALALPSTGGLNFGRQRRSEPVGTLSGVRRCAWAASSPESLLRHGRPCVSMHSHDVGLPRPTRCTTIPCGFGTRVQPTRSPTRPMFRQPDRGRRDDLPREHNAPRQVFTTDGRQFQPDHLAGPPPAAA